MVATARFTFPENCSSKESPQCFQTCQNQPRLSGELFLLANSCKIYIYDGSYQGDCLNHINNFLELKCGSLQELTQAIGEALCTLIDEGDDRDGRPKRLAFCSGLGFMGVMYRWLSQALVSNSS